jgi:hypothetical protein
MSDPTMASLGFESWVEQVDNAIAHVDAGVGDDLRRFDDLANSAYDMLMMGKFTDAAQYGSMARAADVEDLDDDFADYLDSLEQDNVEPVMGDDDYYM